MGYVLLAVTLSVVLWQSSQHLEPGEAGMTPRVRLEHADAVLGPWLYWDGRAYHTIAEVGYTRADTEVFDAGGEARVAFFPGYPLLGRLAGVVVGDTALGLILVTWAAGLGVAVVFHRWLLDRRWTDRQAALAVLALFLFPWAYHLAGAAYSEAVFLLCAISAFRLVEDDRPIAAGLVGAVASGTRIVGLAVAVGLVLRILERRGGLSRTAWRMRMEVTGARRADLGVLLAVGGYLSYVTVCWVRYGDPVAFSTAQRAWGSPAGPRSWFKIPFLDLVQHSPDDWFVMRLLLHGVVGVLFLLAVPAVWRRFGPAYGTYTLIVVGIPMLGAGTFASMGRHMLAAFPVYALLGERMASWPRWRYTGYLVLSGAVLVAWTSFWGRGYWMA